MEELVPDNDCFVVST